MKKSNIRPTYVAGIGLIVATTLISLAGVVSDFLDINPLQAVVHPISTIYSVQACDKYATVVLEHNHVTSQPARCTADVYQAGQGKSLSYVTAAITLADYYKSCKEENQTTQINLSCGYDLVSDDQTYSNWIDQDGRFVEFVQPPRLIQEDPAVYTLGCGQPNSSTVGDTEVRPKLIYESGQYWWLNVYRNTPNNASDVKCRLSGTSKYGLTTTRTDIKPSYVLNYESCKRSFDSACATQKVLATGNPQECLQNGPGSNYEYECTHNYTARTGKTDFCLKGGETVPGSYGPPYDCTKINMIKPL